MFYELIQIMQYENEMPRVLSIHRNMQALSCIEKVEVLARGANPPPRTVLTFACAPEGDAMNPKKWVIEKTSFPRSGFMKLADTQQPSSYFKLTIHIINRQPNDPKVQRVVARTFSTAAECNAQVRPTWDRLAAIDKNYATRVSLSCTEAIAFDVPAPPKPVDTRAYDLYLHSFGTDKAFASKLIGSYARSDECEAARKAIAASAMRSDKIKYRPVCIGRQMIKQKTINET